MLNWLRKAWRRLQRSPDSNQLDLSGDREVEWAFVAGHIPEPASTVLDFGCGNAPLALVAALKGNHVLAIDRSPVQWSVASPAIQFLQADINDYDFGEQSFDVILNCSTVEHVGIGGRYGSTEDADGDLKAMARLRRLLKPAGQMVMTIPVGQDMVCPPLHRIYGKERLPRLIDGYTPRHSEYWVKHPGLNVWVPAEMEEALSIKGGPAFYSLGLFMLGRG